MKNDQGYPNIARIEGSPVLVIVRRLRIVDEGLGRTVNISSGEVLFLSAQPLQVETEIELSIAWPSHGDHEAKATVWATGQTVRVQDGCIAVRVLECEFRGRRIDC